MPTTSLSAERSVPAIARSLGAAPGAIWDKSAPAAVRKTFAAGDHVAGWAAWQRHLVRRPWPAHPAALSPGGRSAIGWALPAGGDARSILAPKRSGDLSAWLSMPAISDSDGRRALELLAWCHALPRLAAETPPPAWWALLDRLLAAVRSADALALDENPYAHQLLAGELPLTLSYLLPEIAPCRALLAGARRALSAGPVDLLDGEGLPHARYFPLLRPLLACWTRCRAVGGELKGGCWTAAAEVQYQWLVRHAMRLARHDGTHVFSNGSAGGPDTDLFRAALRLGGDGDDRRIAALVLPGAAKASENGKPVKKAGRQAKDRMVDLPEPAGHSEWAAAAVLRPQWSRSGERLTVLYPGRNVAVELTCGGEVLFSGTWDLEVRVDGAVAAPASDWSEVCWVSDDQADYLELEIELGAGLCVQRQLLLARKDRFLLLADAVLGDAGDDGPKSIEYRGNLPLGPRIAFEGAAQTREGFLTGRRRRASVLPLALPEWRCDRRVGELVAAPGGLELRQSTSGRRLLAPLFFDLDARRLARPLTWRQLTVGQSLAVQPPEVAVGYRVAVGKRQWLIYRSLAEKANRTLLGCNLSTETLVGRFARTGEVEPLVEIE